MNARARVLYSDPIYIPRDRAYFDNIHIRAGHVMTSVANHLKQMRKRWNLINYANESVAAGAVPWVHCHMDVRIHEPYP